MKICVFIHPRGTPRDISYIKKRIQEGAKVIIFTQHNNDFVVFSEGLKDEGIVNLKELRKSLLMLWPPEDFRNFDKYKPDLIFALKSMGIEKGTKINLEISGGAITDCVMKISPKVVEFFRETYGERYINPYFFYLAGYGYTGYKFHLHYDGGLSTLRNIKDFRVGPIIPKELRASKPKINRK